MQTCPHCKGRGHDRCLQDLDEQGNSIYQDISCYTCNGSGTIPDEPETPDLCEVCGGTGVNGTEGDPDSGLPDEWSDKPCEACDGTGSSDPSIQQTERHIRLVERGEFSSAEGLAINYGDDETDWSDDEEDYEVCPDCDGVGDIEELLSECPTCGGSGYV